ncbi:MAG: hypothetical protein WDW36_004232 [Sanguina aurantia]
MTEFPEQVGEELGMGCDSSSSISRGISVGDSEALAEGARIHVNIEGRYVTILRLKGDLKAIDSICFHAGGPLGLGDIEEVNGRSCILCPWHYYKIDVTSGDKYYQSVSWHNGKMVPGDWQSNGQQQRVHRVTEQDGNIYLTINTEGKVDSDEYACKADCGERVVAGRRAQGGMAGGDGKRSGAIMLAARLAAAKAAAAAAAAATASPTSQPTTGRLGSAAGTVRQPAAAVTTPAAASGPTAIPESE